MNARGRNSRRLINRKRIEKYKLITYARWITLITALLVVFLFFLNTGFQIESPNDVIEQNPCISIGLIICIIDLFIWFQLQHLLKYLKGADHIETIRIQLIVICMIQLMVFHFISFVCLIMALIRYFRWDQFSLKRSFQEIKKENQLLNTLTLTFVLFLFALLAIFMMYLFPVF